MATNLETARKMIETACNAGIQLGVISQHRFDDSTQFLRRAIAEGRLGKILQADAYVKWYRSPAYYSRPIKGSWDTEGGGALITQAIHQVDVLLGLMGGISEVFGLLAVGGAAQHRVRRRAVCAGEISIRRYRCDSGLHGLLAWIYRTHRNPRNKGHGDHLGRQADYLARGERFAASPRRSPTTIASAATDPMATALAPFERQFIDFGEAIRTGRKPPLRAKMAIAPCKR